MTQLEQLKALALELGLEDWIPLPQLLRTAETRGLLSPGEGWQELAAALAPLLQLGRIQVWTGPWPNEPAPVPLHEAAALLQQAQRYAYESPDDGIERVYIVNADNIRD